MQMAVHAPARTQLHVVPKAPAAPPSYVEYGARRALVVAGVMLAALLQTVDATIVNVALPTIQGNLGASVDEATWVVTAYVIANVIVIPLTPWLQMRFGRKAYFLISIAGFTVASVLCGLATSLDSLIIFRVIQGAFGGGLLATAQVILRETFPAEQLGTSQAIYALGAVLGPSIGPTLGGLITDNLSWQWVFDVNIVPGIVAFVLLAIFLREGVRKPGSVDAAGIALLTVAVASLQYVLDQGQHDDWFSNTGICVSSVTAVIAGALFVWWELRAPQPIVDLRVLAKPGVAGASIVAIGNSAGIYGILLLLPQYTVGELGYTSTLAGVLIGLRAIPIALLTIPVGRLVNSKSADPRYFVGIGLLLQAIGTLWLARETVSIVSIASFAGPLILSGIGISIIFTPVLVAAIRSVEPKDAPKASAFVTLSSQLGGSLFAASLVALLDRRQAFHQDALAANANLHAPAVNAFVQSHPLQGLYQIIINQSTILAYVDVFIAVGAVLLLTVPTAALLKGKVLAR